MGRPIDIVLPMVLNQLSQQAADQRKKQKARELASAYSQLLNEGQGSIDENLIGPPTEAQSVQQGKIDAYTKAIEAGDRPPLEFLKKEEPPVNLDLMAQQFPEYAHTIAGIKLLDPKAQQIAARQILDADRTATLDLVKRAHELAPLATQLGTTVDKLMAYDQARKIDPSLAESQFPQLSGFKSPIIQDVLKKMDTGEIVSEDQLTPSQRAEFVRLKIDPANVAWMFSGTKGDTGKMFDNAQKFMTGEMSQQLGDQYAAPALIQSYLETLQGKKDSKGEAVKFSGTPAQKAWIAQNIEPMKDGFTGEYTWRIRPDVLIGKVKEMYDRIEEVKTGMSGAGRANEVYQQLAMTRFDDIIWSEIPRKLQGTPYTMAQLIDDLAKAWGIIPNQLAQIVANKLAQEQQ